MISLRTGRLLASLLLLLAAAGTSFAGATVNELCRTHGIAGEENILRIERSYAAAVKAGIPEDVLLPFVEDILRHKLDCAQMVRVLDMTIRLREADLPYFVVFSKVREGVAKEAAPVRVVEAAEVKFNALSASRGVLKSLDALGYRTRDPQNAAVVISSYIEKGYAPSEIVSHVRDKGIEGGRFSALSGVMEKSVKRKDR